MLLVILKVKKFLQHFTKKNCKKTNQKEFIIVKVMKRKDDKLYVKWKGDSSFISLIDKKSHNINDCMFSINKIFWRKYES